MHGRATPTIATTENNKRARSEGDGTTPTHRTAINWRAGKARTAAAAAAAAQAQIPNKQNNTQPARAAQRAQPKKRLPH